ncbi:hypothetical protein EDB83DRAFT_479956 [Lactarius deliciosus]|nr:hypothetical protein EDB83DRAFT_479956 [Lactarius deliciosus]
MLHVECGWLSSVVLFVDAVPRHPTSESPSASDHIAIDSPALSSSHPIFPSTYPSTIPLSPSLSSFIISPTRLATLSNQHRLERRRRRRIFISQMALRAFID